MNIGLCIAPHNPLYARLDSSLGRHRVTCVSTWLSTELAMLAARQNHCLVVDFSEPNSDQFTAWRLPHLEFMCINSGIALGTMYARRLPVILFDSTYPNFTDKLLLGTTSDSNAAVCGDADTLVEKLGAAADAFDKNDDYASFITTLRKEFSGTQPDAAPKVTKPVKPCDFVLIADPQTKSIKALEEELKSRGRSVHVITNAVNTYPLNLALWEPIRSAKIVVLSTPEDSEAMTNLTQRAILCGMANALRKPTIGLWCMNDSANNTDSVGMHYEYAIEGMVSLGLTIRTSSALELTRVVDICDRMINSQESYSATATQIVLDTRPKTQ